MCFKVFNSDGMNLEMLLFKSFKLLDSCVIGSKRIIFKALKHIIFPKNLSKLLKTSI